MNGSRALVGLAGLAIAGVVLLAALGRPIPDLLTGALAALVGGVAGATVPRRPAIQEAEDEGPRHAYTEPPAAADEPPPWPPWHGKTQGRSQ